VITLAALYTVAGAMFAAYALLTLRDRSNSKRFTSAAFWGLLSVSFLAGDRLGDLGNGVLVLCLVAIAGFGGLGSGKADTTTIEVRDALAKRLGNRLFLPALIIPATALGGTVLFKHVVIGGEALFDPKQVTLISLGLGVVIALLVSMLWLRPSPLAPLQEGRRLMESVGWVAVLPQMLTALGAVFALAGVGDVVGGLAGRIIPDGNLFAAVAVYALGMAGFTMIMGNAFAAFPVMIAAIGVPVLIRGFGGDAAIIGAVGMLAGFCGTLMTPMAANFNILPAALLELKDRNGVIKAQVATALPLLAVNIGLIYFLAFG
jgi:uncharacterized membrane protein